MRLFSAALLLCFATAPLLHADETSKKAKIEELVQITKVDQLADQMTQQMTGRMKAMAAQQTATRTVTPVQQKTINDYIGQIQSITRGAVAWDKIKASVIQNYDQAYTEQELDGILAFYRSPAGQALIAKSPLLMGKTMQLMETQMSMVQPQLRQANEEFNRKMRELAPVAPAASHAAPAGKP
jgi:hypothetical protein